MLDEIENQFQYEGNYDIQKGIVNGSHFSTAQAGVLGWVLSWVRFYGTERGSAGCYGQPTRDGVAPLLKAGGSIGLNKTN